MTSETIEPQRAILRERVQIALDKAADQVVPSGRDCWEAKLTNSVAIRNTVMLDDGWLRMDAPLPKLNAQSGGVAERTFELLRANATLPGGVKYILDERNRPHVRTEIPMDEEVGVTRIVEACAGFQIAAHRFARAEPGPPAKRQPADESEPPDDDGKCDLQDLFKQAGWGFAARDDGRLAVALEAPGDCHQAIVRARPNGVHITVELASRPPASQPCREAFGFLLLDAGRLVRMVRAAMQEEHGGPPRVGLEVGWTACPAATEVAHALAALSVACRLCAREMQMIEDETVAGAYLSRRAHAS